MTCYVPLYPYSTIFTIPDSVQSYVICGANVLKVCGIHTCGVVAFFSKVEPVILNILSVNPIKWSNTLKKFVGKLLANCLSVFDHFVGLALKKLTLLKTALPFN